MRNEVQPIFEKVRARDPDQPEFLQAVEEVFESLGDFIVANPVYMEAKILERIVEPERVIMFRVPWETDEGEVMVNRGVRVEFNSAIGPYKGGLRFHPTVNLGIIKFLGFEQVFSDSEVMRFCQSFMTELCRHIGPNVDVPAGDIGVGAREIGYMFGQYKRIRNEFTGVLTGKGLKWGGSLIRPEATGYGATYFAEEMLKTKGDSVEGKTCLVSGSGNVAQYTVEKVNQLGGKCITLSDSGGFIHDPEGINDEKLAYVMELKNVKRGRIREYAEKFNGVEDREADPNKDYNPLWAIPAYCAFPSATQNEINEKDAENLIAGSVKVVSEGANMPSTPDAIEVFLGNKILYGPGKAANAGGVSVSGLEMSQNSLRLSWTREEVDERLRGIMAAIHDQCVEHGKEGDFINYVNGANIGGFVKVADAMMDQGLV
jgi:glutamate dehydrogenase (NADP+)